MKSEISRDSYQSEKRYSGVYQQQGRMLTDADWNELVDILKSQLNDALRDVIGSEQGSRGGTPRHRALRIIEDSGIKIQPGYIYIDGMAASLPGSDPINLDEQVDFPNSPVATGNYVLYADVWERTVTQLMDSRLLDAGLHGADTCTRKQMMAQIKWCPDSIDPEQSVVNPAKGDAGLTLTLLQKTTDPDACDPCAAELDIDTRVGNYLFRVEVHDVQGDANNPSEITLKWSSENGAEQFEALASEDLMPAGFISDKWVYEFFDATTERHMGVHLNTNPWQPAREQLAVFNEIAGAYTVPVISGSSETKTLVRRWDGYCKIDLTSGLLLEGMDRGVTLDTSKAPTSLGYVSLSSTLEMMLNSLSIELDIDSKSFVAGDFWLADVREAVHSEGSRLLDNQAPHGITHYYLTLASVTAGVLQKNPEIDRKYAFPPLTQMTRLFMAGGDGQEIVPGEKLPQPLRVGVANGEWPVIGATVRFAIETGGGSLNVINAGLTNAEGIAECEWTPAAVIGANCRVKATLEDPDNPSDTSKDLAPPVYFYANLISADQVAYAPQCQPDTPEASVHHLLLGPDDTRLGSDDYYTVKEVLDALLCELKADHIPYDEVSCASAHTVKSLLADLDFTADGFITVKDVLDTLLCKLAAQHLPYDPATQGSRWDDINDADPRPNTVQQAIDDLTQISADDIPLDRDEILCESLKSDASIVSVQDALNYLCERKAGTSCAISVGIGGQYETLEQALRDLSEIKEICICLLPGEHWLKEEITLSAKTSFRISGCGAEASKIFIMNRLAISAIEVQLRDISIIGGEKPDVPTSSGNLILTGLKNSHFIVENCIFNRVFKGAESAWLPPVIIDGNVRLDWHKNRMSATRQDELMAAAVTPGKAGLTGKALSAVEMLEGVWVENPYAATTAYDERVKAAAEALANLSEPQRKKIADARDVSRIEKLPVEAVNINRSMRMAPGVAASIGAAAAPAATTGGANNNIAALRMARAVSPRSEAEALFNDIQAIGTVDVNILIDRIRALAQLVTSFDYALALGSNRVGGEFTQNEVLGNLALQFSQPDVQTLHWPSVDTPERRKIKPLIAGRFNNPEWPIQQQLHIQQNTLNEVHNMMPPEQLKIIPEALNGNLPDSFVLPAYESLFISGNVFEGDQNSFMGRFVNLTDNHFLYQNDKGGIVAYVLGYRGVIAGNHSYWEDSPEYIIDQILARYLPLEESNFVKII